MNKLSQNNFFLISFLPAIAYWYLEENYPIKIAITGGLILAILEITFEYFYTKHIHTLSKFNFYLILFLGGVSLLGEDGVWFKLQPAFTGMGISSFMIFRLLKGKGLLLEMTESFSKNKNDPNNRANVPDFIFQQMEKHIIFLFGGYGLFMIFVALRLSTDQWLFFKTIGFYIVFGIFIFIEIFWMRRKISKWHESLRSAEILKAFDPNSR